MGYALRCAEYNALLSIAVELWLCAADCALLSRAIQVKRSTLITGCQALIRVRSFLPAASSKRPSHAALYRRGTEVSDRVWLVFKLEPQCYSIEERVSHI